MSKDGGEKLDKADGSSGLYPYQAVFFDGLGGVLPKDAEVRLPRYPTGLPPAFPMAVQVAEHLLGPAVAELRAKLRELAGNAVSERKVVVINNVGKSKEAAALVAQDVLDAAIRTRKEAED